MMNKKGKTLAELARMVGGDLAGDPEIVIDSLADITGAGAGQITFLVKGSQAASLAETDAAAVIVPLAVDSADKPLIRVKDPYMAAAVIQNSFLAKSFQATGISLKAHIGQDCQIPAATSIGPMVSIGDRVRLGERVTIYPGVVIGDDVKIGDDSILFANVTIYHSCTIGERVQIHSGTVSACHDLSDGGLAVALAEMALAGDIGAKIDERGENNPLLHAWLFGEDQARYLVTVTDGRAFCDAARQAGVAAEAIGLTGGDSLVLPGARSLALDDLRRAHEDWLPAYMQTIA